MATIEDMLEEQAWRDRNGLDDLAWNPDAVAPPFGDIYERERGPSHELLAWGLVAVAAGLVAFALAVLRL